MGARSYRTIGRGGEAEYEVQKSRFIAHTAHAETEEDAQAFVRRMKKQYFDARHNCFAWVLGETSNQQKSNDDGEPGGTAGNPILEAIKKRGLTNAVIVVTRYFGGIKLGAGGLIRAYGHAAALGIDVSGIIEQRSFRHVALSVDYALLGAVENFMRQKEIRTGEKAYEECVRWTLYLENAMADALLQEIADLTAGKAAIEELGNARLAIPSE